MQPGIVPYSGKTEWIRILLLVAVLAVIVLGITTLTISLLYSTAIKQQAERLLEVVQSEARTIEAIARHEQITATSEDPSTSSYLDVLMDAHAHYEGFGDTGEYTLAKQEAGQIVFLLSHRHYDLEYPEPVPMDSAWAEPMRRALRGESGTMIGLDYRGSIVLAAFEPVATFGLGIVAKIDLAEIQAPYRTAALQSLGPALIVIVLGALVFSRITRPIVRRVAEGQQRYQELVETMQDGLAIQDEHGMIQYVNNQYCRILGRSREQLVGTDTSRYLSPESKTRYGQEAVQRRKGSSSTYELAFVRLDGSEVVTLVSGQPILDARGVFRGSFATVSDITRLKEIERQLRSEKEQAQLYLDIAGVMFVVLDRTGRIVMLNRKGLEILGYTSDSELRGKSWFEMCIPSDIRGTVREVFVRIMAGELEPVDHFENSVITRESRTRTIAWHNTILRDNAGNAVGTLSSGEDITEQRQAEQERLEMESHLRQGQKLESIGTLASGVAHEINNPLTGIINYAQLIHDRIDNDALRDYARGIIEEGNRVANIVKSLLSFSRQENERHSPADMSDIINSAISLIGSVLRKDQIQLIVHIPSDLPALRCRSQQIQQVLVNLLTNARDALNDRYPEFDKDKIARIDVDLVKREGRSWIRTIVEDHGSGMPASIIGRVFDPFFSTKPKERGTGLGLSISYGLVREHHGRLMIESEPNAYTRVTMELPVENGWSVEEQAAS